MAFLYASARYSAYVAKAILDAPNHEDFVKEMTARYQEMLRQHLADPSLAKPEALERCIRVVQRETLPSLTCVLPRPQSCPIQRPSRCAHGGARLTICGFAACPYGRFAFPTV